MHRFQHLMQQHVFTVSQGLVPRNVENFQAVDDEGVKSFCNTV